MNDKRLELMAELKTVMFELEEYDSILGYRNLTRDENKVYTRLSKKKHKLYKKINFKSYEELIKYLG